MRGRPPTESGRPPSCPLCLCQSKLAGVHAVIFDRIGKLEMDRDGRSKPSPTFTCLLNNSRQPPSEVILGAQVDGGMLRRPMHLRRAASLPDSGSSSGSSAPNENGEKHVSRCRR